MASDADLMVRVQKGCSTSFETLVDRFRPRLLRFAVSKLQDRSRAEDVVQETFLAVYAARESYNPNFAFSTWIWTILLNLCRREWRRRSRDLSRHATTVSIEAPEVAGRLEAPGTESGLATLLKTERDEQLHQLLNELPEAQADALRLRFFAELKFDEIAGAMDSSISGAKARVRGGLARLAERLRDLEESQRPVTPAEPHQERSS